MKSYTGSSCLEDAFEAGFEKIKINAVLIGGFNDDEIEALVDVLLPGVIKFFSSDEWRAEFEEWKKERELLLAQREEQKVLALKADESKVS